MKNSFLTYGNIGKWLIQLLTIVALALVAGKIISTGGLPAAAALAILPFTIAFLFVVFKRPYWGLIAYLVLSFFVLGLNRYIPGPLGLSIDGILVLTILASVFSAPKENIKNMYHPVTLVMLLWFIVTFLELFNPQAVSSEAWFYAVRGISLYSILSIPLIFILMPRRKDLNTFIHLWLALSVAGALWGYRQHYIGPDWAESIWLENGGKLTHILMGRLRVFSFYSDAGQYGASMAQATLLAIILAFGPVSVKRKVAYFAMAAICFWGLAISGSRGPLIILFSGFFMYLIMVRNFKVLIIGSIAVVAFAGFLKFTTIGQGNYQVQRMRSALDPNDPSLLVRLANQAKLSEYLADKPYGGGIGSVGTWGQRFSPGTFLANLPPDSWYVRIWAEMGIIGLCLHIGTILFVLVFSYRGVYRVKDPTLRPKLIGIYCCYFGIAIGAYGNQIYGQLPISSVICFSIVYLFLAKKLEEEPEEKTVHEATQPPAARIDNYRKL